jgi:3-oxo-5-alpha-steroid 4-dehydrogenase 1
MHLPDIPYSDFQIFLFIWLIIAVIIFFILLRIAAPYGRHSSGKWGPTISNRWGWLLMEFPVLLILAICVIPFFQKISIVSWICLGLFCLHYFNRCFVFPFRLNTKGKQMPLIIVGSAIMFNLINGFSLGYYFTHFAHYSTIWISDPRFIFGFVLFFAGIYINWKADNILIHLRKPGETNYLIPKNWLFEYISCPNLFGELIEWLGFSILCWNPPALCFFLWTAANLIPRAISHHKWYRRTFVDYPSNRYAIIPFII